MEAIWTSEDDLNSFRLVPNHLTVIKYSYQTAADEFTDGDAESMLRCGKCKVRLLLISIF